MENLDKIISYILFKKPKIIENGGAFRINKLLYFIQAYHLTIYNKPAFNNKITCGMFGAIVRDFTKENRYYFHIEKYKNNSYLALDKQIKKTVDKILNTFYSIDVFVLSNLTMNYIPFYKRKWDILELENLEVSQEWIKNFHKEHIKNNNGYIF